MLDSLDAEGNIGTKQDALSSWVRSADRRLDDEDSYRLDIHGEYCLRCPDDT